MFRKSHWAKQHINKRGYKARTVGEGNLVQAKYSSSCPPSTQPISLHKYKVQGQS